jgi:HEAT repeat protein
MNSILTMVSLRFLVVVAVLGASLSAISSPAAPEASQVDEFRGKLRNGLTFARRVAVEKLGNLGPAASSAIPELAAVLTDDSDQMTRIRAAWALGQIKAPLDQVAPALLRALPDEDSVVARSAAQALGGLGPAVLPYVVKELKSEEPAARLAAAELHLHFASDSPDPVLPIFGDLLSNPRADLRLRSLIAINRIGVKAAPLVPRLLSALADTDPGVRSAAVRAIGAVKPDQDAVRKIAALLAAEPSKPVRQTVAEVLGTNCVSHPEALTALINAFKDKDDRTRAVACAAAARFGPKSVPSLVEAARASSQQNRIRRAAIETLMMVGPDAEAAVPELQAYLLKDDDWLVRHHAAAALGAIAPRTKEGVQALEHAARKDPHSEVRTEAERSLAKIQGCP